MDDAVVVPAFIGDPPAQKTARVFLEIRRTTFYTTSETTMFKYWEWGARGRWLAQTDRVEIYIPWIAFLAVSRNPVDDAPVAVGQLWIARVNIHIQHTYP